MDRPSELVLKARDTHWRVREIAPDVNEWEYKMINDLLDIVLQFPIVKPHEDTTREETSPN